MVQLEESGVAVLGEGCRRAAVRLHTFLAGNQLKPDGSVTGPDSGTRLNLRAWRFIKSYLSFIPVHDERYYCQAQYYWIASNLQLLRMTGDDQYRQRVLACAESLLGRQTENGHWILSNPEWNGRITTVETCFGALSLLAAFGVEKDERFIEGAKRARDHMVDVCGFTVFDDTSSCVNYFSNHPSGLVPNNATLALWFLAELAGVTGDVSYRQHCPQMVGFLKKCQLESGELPYALRVEVPPNGDRLHYLCFQYNAFEFIDLTHYYRLTNDPEMLPVMRRLAGFLSTGLTKAGDARYNCHKDWPTMHYFTAVVSAALLIASRLGLGDYASEANRGYARLLSWQKPNGAYDYSTGDYRLLSDKRPYARNLAMILRHLLVGAEERE